MKMKRIKIETVANTIFFFDNSNSLTMDELAIELVDESCKYIVLTDMYGLKHILPTNNIANISEVADSR